jgi:predicted aspartyl protease
MGTLYIRGTVSHNGNSAALDFLVDSGIQYTLLPLETWRALKLEAIDSMRFVLADGTGVERRVSECQITIEPYGSRHTPAMLGEQGDRALLGIVSLAEFGLMLNPFARTLQPMRMRL